MNKKLLSSIAATLVDNSKGILAADSVKGFYNEAWQKQVSLPLEPLFLSNSPAVLNILEDSTSGASYLFQVEHPLESNFLIL